MNKAIPEHKLKGYDTKIECWIDENDLWIKKDPKILGPIIDRAKEEHPQAPDNFIIGVVMRETKGTACPKVVLELLKKLK